uniref:RRM domain-containing protein n=1 Tax=Spongospora subterranea TaxID=70186 RepID=A0A0H5R7U4_9EUKA|eukprot:CRZ09881.1 hypothetical protein [Spongospora subterranea]
MSLADVDEIIDTQTQMRRVLYVGGLSIDMTEEMLRDAFVVFGDLVDVSIPSVATGVGEKTRRFAFIEYEEAEDAICAKENMNDSELLNRIIYVKFADERRSLEKARPVWAQAPVELEKDNDTLADNDNAVEEQD